MKIALLNTIKPIEGSGDGVTEYTYNIYKQLSKSNDVELVHAVEKARRVDITGLLYAFSLFRFKIKKLARRDFDIIHITNQELGFAAKILKKNGTKAKVITTIHDLMRLEEGYTKGRLQGAYNKLITSSINDAIGYSDYLVFSATPVMDNATRRFGRLKNSKTLLLAIKDSLRNTPIQKKKKREEFIVGYIGALTYYKNVRFLLETANELKRHKNQFKFMIYGTGAERENLIGYKEKKGLDNVFLPGFVEESKIVSTYDNFDACIFPTKGEGFGLPILDAQARGIPVIAARHSRVDKEVTKHCFLADTPSEAANILLKLRKNGYSRKEMLKARRHARSFSWERVGRETMKLYRSLNGN